MWIVLPVCFLFLGPEQNINWVWGPFNKPQTFLPPIAYLALCMVAYPPILYAPTHALLSMLFTRCRRGTAPDR